jgi:hypothetical protein
MAGERADATGPAPAEHPDPTLIAQRMRDAVTATAPSPRAELLSPYALERWLEGDAGHLQRAADLRSAPVASPRPVLGRPVVWLKRTLRRLLYPLIDIQSDVNAANARVVAFLLEQLAAQAHCIDDLQRQLAELRSRLP